MVGTFQCVMQARRLQLSEFRQSIRPLVPDIAGIQKQTLQLFFYNKDIAPPFDSSKYGCFCNKYGHVFPILKTRINGHVKGPKYLIVSNLFLLY